MKKVKIFNVPGTIFLQVGDLDGDVDFADLSLEDVTWGDEKIFDSDLEYRLVKRKVRPG